jgi:GT2 family glycosyltransferase
MIRLTNPRMADPHPKFVRAGGRGAVGMTIVSIVILTYSRDPVLREVLDDLAGLIAERDDCEVLLVDNNADDVDRGAWLSRFARAQWLHMGENVGVIGRNVGMSRASGPIIGLLDDDVFIQTADFPDVLARIFGADPELGAVTIHKVLSETGETRRDLIPHSRKDVDMTRPFDTFRFVGGFMALRREAYERVGGFSPEFFYGCEEVELSYRLIDGGWKILYSPEILAVELEHPSGRAPVVAAQTMRLRNRYIMAWMHMPFPQILFNYLFFTPYIAYFARGQIDIVKAVGGLLTWLRRGDRPQRKPLGPRAIAYIRSCRGSTWR